LGTTPKITLNGHDRRVSREAAVPVSKLRKDVSISKELMKYKKGYKNDAVWYFEDLLPFSSIHASAVFSALLK
jgi:hypothetical protein